MHIERHIMGKEGTLEELLLLAITGDKIFLGTFHDLGSFDANQWDIGRRGLVIKKPQGLTLNGKVLCEYEAQWLAAGDGIIILKGAGLHYIALGQDQLIFSGEFLGQWSPSENGVIVEDGDEDSFRLTEYGLNGSTTVHYIPSEGEKPSRWEPCHLGGVLIDISADNQYKIVHVVENGERKVIYDEKRYGRKGSKGWCAHPLGVMSRSGSSFVLNGEEFLKDHPFIACYSAHGLPGVIVEDDDENYYLLVHKV